MGRPADGRSGPRARALVVGLLGVVAAVVVVSYAELLYDMPAATLQLPLAAVAVLLVVVAANRAVGRAWPRQALSAQELVVVYLMTTIGAMLAGRGLMEKLLPTLAAWSYFSDEANRYLPLLSPHLPSWWAPQGAALGADSEAVRGLYEGLSVGEKLPWGAWWPALGAWAIPVVGTWCMFVALASWLRRPWAEGERLAFPLAQVPLELAWAGAGGREGAGLLRSRADGRVFALGALLPVLVYALNAWNRHNPNVPVIPLSISLNALFTERPWTFMGYTAVIISFSAIGFAYLVPAEMLLSVWAFFLFMRWQDVMCGWVGLPQGGMSSQPASWHTGYQVMGAYFVLAATLMARAWRRPGKPGTATGFGRIEPSHADRNQRNRWLSLVFPQEAVARGELLRPRACLALFAIGWVACTGWGIASGLSTWLAVAEFTVLPLVVAVVMSRAVAEAGYLMVEASFCPVDLVGLVAKPMSIGPRNTALVAFVETVFMRDLRGLISTPILDALWMAEPLDLPRRRLLAPIALALVGGALTAGVVHLRLAYSMGGNLLSPYLYSGGNCRVCVDWASRELNAPTAFDPLRPVFFAGGALLTVLMIVARRTFVRFALLPLGYAMMPSWATLVLWFPCLVAWLVKKVLLRLYGYRGYLAARPFFVGMIVGEVIVAVVWTLVSVLLRLQPPFMPLG